MNIYPEIAEIKNILQQHSEILVQVLKEQNYLRGALDQVNERLGSLENRVENLEIRGDTLNDRINEVKTELRTEIQEMESRLSKENREMESRLSKENRELESRLSKEIRDNLKWLIGLMVPVWIGIFVAVITQFFKG
jgi:chromosome segregation ATPase